MRPRSLKEVPTDDLRALLQHVHRGDLPCPVRAEGLACVGLQHRQEPLLEVLRGLDAPATRALIVAVIAERTG